VLHGVFTVFSVTLNNQLYTFVGVLLHGSEACRQRTRVQVETLECGLRGAAVRLQCLIIDKSTKTFTAGQGDRAISW
jgi:hypothetical protein